MYECNVRANFVFRPRAFDSAVFSRGSISRAVENNTCAARKPHSIGANRLVAAPLPRKRDNSYARGHSGGQSPIRLALSLVEIVCVKPAIGSWISATDSKCDSLNLVTASVPLAPVEQSIV
jgi:hypothetical protein